MENDYLVNIYKMYYTKSKLSDLKVSKIIDVMGLSPNHIFSSKNGNNYYISMNFKIFANAIK